MLAKRHGRRTAGAIMVVALASRFWRLGCPKIYHEVATRLGWLAGAGGAAHAAGKPGHDRALGQQAIAHAGKAFHGDGSLLDDGQQQAVTALAGTLQKLA